MKTLIKFQLISILTLTAVVLAWAHDIGLMQHNAASPAPSVGMIRRSSHRPATTNLSLLNFGSMAWSLTDTKNRANTEKLPITMADTELEKDLVSANPADRSAALSRLLWLNHIAGQPMDWRTKHLATHEEKNL